MSLRTALHTLADQAPPPAVPPDLFDRAQAARRRRHASRAAALAVVVVLLVIGYGLRPGSGTPNPSGSPGAAAPVGLPRTIVVPPLWTARIELSRLGPAAMIFGGSATTSDWNEGRFAAVAADRDRYRVIDGIPYTPPGFEALLSPDGRLLARSSMVIPLDGRGDEHSLPGQPLAFSPDSSRIVYQREDGRVGVFDIGAKRVVATIGVGGGWVTPGWSAAVSPDNRKLALRVSFEFHTEIRLYELTDSAKELQPYVSERQDRFTRLAGPAAWRPDNQSLVIARHTAAGTSNIGWSFDVVHDATHLPWLAPAVFLPGVEGRYVRLIGWRPDGTAVGLVGVPKQRLNTFEPYEQHPWVPFHDLETDRVRLVEIVPGADAPTTLLETQSGVSEVDVAADLAIRGAFRDAGEPSFGPPHDMFLVGGAAVVILVGGIALAMWLRRRRPGPRIPTRT